MDTNTDRAAHKDQAAKITAATLRAPLADGYCYAIANCYGQRDGIMPLVEGEEDDWMEPMTSRDLAEKAAAAMAEAHKLSIVSPRLVTVRVAVARAWLAI